MAQPTTGPLPGNVSFGTVTGRFLTAVADSPDDPDRDPEGLPATDLSIRFVPNLTPAVVRDASASPPAIFALAEVVATVGPTGDLLGPDGQPGIRLVASTGAALDPAGWTWQVTLSAPTFPTMSFSFALDPGQTVELASVVQVPASPGATLDAWLQAVADAQAAADRAEAAAAGATHAPHYVQGSLGIGDGNAHWSVDGDGMAIAPLDLNATSDPDNWDTSVPGWRVPVSGLYQLTAAVRPTDGYPAGLNLGMGVDSSTSGGATFVWHGITTAFRHTLQLSRVAHLTAGETVYLYCYFEGGPRTVTTAALGIALIAAD